LVTLEDYQVELVELPFDSKVFLEGPAGSGKTTTAVERLLFQMSNGVHGDSILVLVPHRSLGGVYYDALQQPGVLAGGAVTLVTLGGLARRAIDLFWPVVADQAGFNIIPGDPTFLTMETAQYFMAHLVNPLLKRGLFDSVNLEPNRIYSQIIDNLNKSAIIGFPHTQIGDRLKAAWSGEPGQKNVYEDVQSCANLFREYCVKNNLMDYSLQIEVFVKHLWQLPQFDDYFFRSYRHIIVDNLEEDTPVSHDILEDWVNKFQSGMLVYDNGSGFRRFLGSDPVSAYKLKTQCDLQVEFTKSFVCSENIKTLSFCLSNAFKRLRNIKKENHLQEYVNAKKTEKIRIAFDIKIHRYYPSMIDWCVEIAERLFNEGISPGEIVIMAPYLSDSIRFMLVERFKNHNIPVRTHRPSRPLREEPAVRCLLTLAALAYPNWRIPPSKTDVTNALLLSISGMDLIRAHLLTQIVYRDKQDSTKLTEFAEINSDMQERITYRYGAKYEYLREWLNLNQNSIEDFDHFLNRLFGEVLSQPGFGFYEDFDAGRITANLIESIQKFRWVTESNLTKTNQPVGKEYLTMVQNGVIAAQYLKSWQEISAEAVYLAPAYTFLMENRPVDYQIWLDLGNRGWYERLSQPLTHPYVLSRNWPSGSLWTDHDEVHTGLENLNLLSLGLLRRCRSKVFWGISELGEQGYEHRGPFLQAIQQVLKSSAG